MRIVAASATRGTSILLEAFALAEAKRINGKPPEARGASSVELALCISVDFFDRVCLAWIPFGKIKGGLRLPQLGLFAMSADSLSRNNAAGLMAVL